jgi:hypothetical protein
LTAKETKSDIADSVTMEPIEPIQTMRLLQWMDLNECCGRTEPLM